MTAIRGCVVRGQLPLESLFESTQYINHPTRKLKLASANEKYNKISKEVESDTSCTELIVLFKV